MDDNGSQVVIRLRVTLCLLGFLSRNSSFQNAFQYKRRAGQEASDTLRVPHYVNCLTPKSHCSSLSKIRCGVAHIRVETGCYERLTLTDRICFHCQTSVEDEVHVLAVCPL